MDTTATATVPTLLTEYAETSESGYTHMGWSVWVGAREIGRVLIFNEDRINYWQGFDTELTTMTARFGNRADALDALVEAEVRRLLREA